MASSDVQHLPLATDEEEANDHVELGTIPSSPTGNQQDNNMDTGGDNEGAGEDDDEDDDEENSLLATKQELEKERQELHRTRRMLDKARNEQKSLKCFAAVVFVTIVFIVPNWLLAKPPPKPWTGKPRQLQQDFLCIGDRLHSGDSMKSANGLIQMQFQDDGNLVIYNRNNSCFTNTPKCAIWASNTNGQAPRRFSRFEFQRDHNLAIYPNSFAYDEPALWSSHTKQGKVLLLSNDGDLVLYSSDGNKMWFSHSKSTGAQSAYNPEEAAKLCNMKGKKKGNDGKGTNATKVDNNAITIGGINSTKTEPSPGKSKPGPSRRL